MGLSCRRGGTGENGGAGQVDITDFRGEKERADKPGTPARRALRMVATGT